MTGIYRTADGSIPSGDSLVRATEEQVYCMMNHPSSSAAMSHMGMMRGRDVVLVILKEDSSMRRVEYIPTPAMSHGLMPAPSTVYEDEAPKFKKEDNNILLLLN